MLRNPEQTHKHLFHLWGLTSRRLVPDERHDSESFGNNPSGEKMTGIINCHMIIDELNNKTITLDLKPLDIKISSSYTLVWSQLKNLFSICEKIKQQR